MLAPREHKDPQGLRDQPVQTGHKAPLAPKARRDSKVTKETKVDKEARDQRERKAARDQPEPKAARVRLELKAIKEAQVRKDLLAVLFREQPIMLQSLPLRQ